MKPWAMGGVQGPQGAPGAGGAVWDSGTTYAEGDLVLDRGGIWQATGSSTNSQPISGNTDWTLIGGVPYVDVTLDPVDLTTAPFYNGAGLQVLAAPGESLMILPVYAVTSVSAGVDWPYENPIIYVGWLEGGAIDYDGLSFSDSPTAATVLAAGKSPVWFSVVNYFEGFLEFDRANKALVIQTPDDITIGGIGFGTRSVLVRIYYQIINQSVDAGTTFYRVIALHQGNKTFTVTDAGADLDGATGTFEVVGSTANDGTYTIVSAVSGAGDTVITVVEAIPSATADGWAKFT